MQYYAKILCVAAAVIVLVAFVALVFVLPGPILASAVQGHWLRVAAHTICLLVSTMMVLLVCDFIDKIIR